MRSWRHADGELLLEDEQVGHELGEIVGPLAQDAGRVPHQTPAAQLSRALVQLLQQVLHRAHRVRALDARVPVEAPTRTRYYCTFLILMPLESQCME